MCNQGRLLFSSVGNILLLLLLLLYYSPINKLPRSKQPASLHNQSFLLKRRRVRKATTHPPTQEKLLDYSVIRPESNTDSWSCVLRRGEECLSTAPKIDHCIKHVTSGRHESQEQTSTFTKIIIIVP